MMKQLMKKIGTGKADKVATNSFQTFSSGVPSSDLNYDASRQKYPGRIGIIIILSKHKGAPHGNGCSNGDFGLAAQNFCRMQKL